MVGIFNHRYSFEYLITRDKTYVFYYRQHYAEDGRERYHLL